jgi:NADH:ubiquinone oxidoreductase subunit 3 (subunit A)
MWYLGAFVERESAMLSQYIPVIVGFLWAAFLAAVLIGVSLLFGPKRPNPQKRSTYECGIDPMIGDARARFSVKFYVVAVLFLLFDLEVVFMYPWAVLLRKLGLLGLIEMMTFLLVLVVAFVYVWKKGALNWE